MIGTDKKPIQQVSPVSSADSMVQTTNLIDSEHKGLNREQLKIIDWLKEVQFQKQFFGGINEEDVWKKIHQLNEMYDAALKAERIRYDVLLENQNKDSGPTAQKNDVSKEVEVDG